LTGSGKTDNGVERVSSSNFGPIGKPAQLGEATSLNVGSMVFCEVAADLGKNE
jgi:hypothetical protein